MNGKRILRKIVEISKIKMNESDSERIGKRFEIVRMNKKLRKTLEYYQNKKTNNCLEPEILLEEIQEGKEYFFTCLEGAARITAMKRNEKLKYLKCRVKGAEKGINEIKRINDEYIEIRKLEPIVIRFDDCPAEIKETYSRKPVMKKTRLPTIGKISLGFNPKTNPDISVSSPMRNLKRYKSEL